MSSCGCGCSLVDVGVRHVAVAKVLGTSDSANIVWLMPGAHRKRHMLMKHYQDYDPHTEYVFLVVFYKLVHFSMCPRHEPQQHSEVQGGCGCSPVGVGFRIVHVAMVLGM